MTDLEIMNRAKFYIDKLANGFDPITGKPVNENDVINNVRISRCLFYVAGVLDKVIQNGGIITAPKTNKAKTPFCLSAEQIKNFPFSQSPIPVSEIAKRLNAISDTDNCKKITHRHITNWLVGSGFLEIVTSQDERTKKIPTDSGKSIGILTEKRIGTGGEYSVVLYNIEAQQFIVDNIDTIINYYINSNKRTAPEQSLNITNDL